MDPKTTVSLAFLVQLYAPLAGLLVVVFWLGKLTQRMTAAEERQTEMREEIKVLNDERSQVAVMASKLVDMATAMEKMGRELSGMQRSLANIASGTVGTLVKYDQSEH